jgi:hypothetical protein
MRLPIPPGSLVLRLRHASCRRGGTAHKPTGHCGKKDAAVVVSMHRLQPTSLPEHAEGRREADLNSKEVYVELASLPQATKTAGPKCIQREQCSSGHCT